MGASSLLADGVGDIEGSEVGGVGDEDFSMFANVLSPSIVGLGSHGHFGHSNSPSLSLLSRTSVAEFSGVPTSG